MVNTNLIRYNNLDAKQRTLKNVGLLDSKCTLSPKDETINNATRT